MPEDIRTYENLKQEILESIVEKKFLVFCGDFPYKDGNILQDKLIELHNLGIIDVVSEFNQLQNAGPHKTNFFPIRHIFEKILPHIQADVRATAFCVSKLNNEAGQDMVAGTIVDQFAEFCKQNIQLTEDLLELALTEPKLKRFLTLALVSGMHFDSPKYLSLAMKLIKETSDDDIKAQAIASLRFATPFDAQTVDEIVNSINEQLDISVTDLISANICLVVEKLYFIAEYRQQAIIIFRRIFTIAEDLTYYRLAYMLDRFKQEDSDLVSEVFQVLQRISPNQAGTLQIIDWASDQLIIHGHFRQLLEFIEFLLKNNQEVEIGKTFSSFSRCLLRDPQKLNQTTTRWLIADSFYLRQAVGDIFSLHADDIQGVVFDRALLTEKVDAVFLAKRAIGFLYVFPRQCASFLVSVLAEAEDSQKNDVVNYIRDPLLLSFPGLTQKTITSLLPTLSPATVSLLQQIIDEEKEYATQLIDIRNSTQLGPSESQREACRRKNIQWQKDVSEKAREASAFMQLFHTSIILYHGRMVSRVKNTLSGDSNYRRIETSMNHFSHSVEFPMLSILDPLHERFLLFQCRFSEKNEP